MKNTNEIFESVEKIKELFHELYGVEVDVDLYVHSNNNNETDKKKAVEIVSSLTQTHKVWEGEETVGCISDWVNNFGDFKTPFDVCVHYNKEGSK